MRKTRFAVTIGATLALGVATLAYADGVSENDAGVEGSASPKKLDKKKYKPIELFTRRHHVGHGHRRRSRTPSRSTSPGART